MCQRVYLECVSAVILLVMVGVGSACGGESDFTPPEMKVPEGFVVEVAAAPPLVQYPMMGCLDEVGRLFIAESRGHNLDKEGLLEAKHRFIRMLEDTDGDGRFDKSTIFADGLVMPEGALCYRGSLYVLSSPYLWRFEDTNGDGVADVREKLVGEMEFNGKANQHGAYLGPCGRLYFSGGTFGYDLVGSDGKPAYPVGKATAAGVFSCRLDGSDVEIFATGGINPVEVAFSPEGELFTTCPIIDNIDGRHDALIHWVRGATVGPKDFRPPPLPQTGYRLPALSRWGQVAPSGLMTYRGEAFGREYRDRLFATYFNTRTVVSTRLERHGSTYRSSDEDFLTSPNPDFHPTDIMQDADGSLLLIDTGGWFRISCPFSKTAKPEIPGAIYRIRRADANPVDDPHGLALNWTDPTRRELWERLNDPRPVVRDRTIAAWHELGSAAAEFLVKRFRYEAEHPDNSSPQRRRNAIWAASRIGTERCRRLVRYGLSDSDGTVRQAAVRSAGILRDSEATAKLADVLLGEQSSWPLRRAAATSLGQIGDSAAVSGLLTSAAQGGDDFFNHAVVYALIEIGDFDETAKGLASGSPQLQHAALVALDRIDSEKLTREHVAPLLQTDDERLRRTVLELISQRDGWSDQIVEFLEDYIVTGPPSPARDAILRGAVVNFANDKRVQDIVAKALSPNSIKTKQARTVLLEAVARIETLPEVWIAPLTKSMTDQANPVSSQETIAALLASGTNQFDRSLRAVASSAAFTQDVRAAAWSCLCARGERIPDDALALLLERVMCAAILPPLDRLEAARAVASASLTESQLHEVAKFAYHARPMELPALLHAFHGQPDSQEKLPPRTAITLLESLGGSPGLTALSRGDLDAIVRRFPADIGRKSGPLFEKLNATDAKQTQRLDEIASQLVEGEAERGRKLFFSNRVACSACHRIAGQGGTIGPDLSRIGSIRKRRDLLEAIVFPSATIVNNYETWSALTQNGRTHTGVIQRATSRSLVLRNTQRMEIVLDRIDVEELVRHPTSIMPQGLDRTLTPAELSDLLAFLQSLREQKK